LAADYFKRIDLPHVGQAVEDEDVWQGIEQLLLSRSPVVGDLDTPTNRRQGLPVQVRESGITDCK